MRMADLQRGWSVMTNDGRHYGDVREVGQNYLVVSRSMLSSNVHVPASAIGNVEHKRVHLNLSRSEAESMDWSEPPTGGDEPVAPGASDLHRHV